MAENKKYQIVRVVTVEEAVSFHLKNTLRQIGQDFSVAVVGSNVEQFNGQYPGVDFYNIEVPRQISLVADLRSVFSLVQFFRKHQPQIVHSIMPKAGLVSALAAFVARVPCRVHTFTGQVWATQTGLKARMLMAFDQLITNLNTHVFTDSSSQSDFLYTHGIMKNQKAIPVLGYGSLSGVDLAVYDRALYSDFAQKFKSEQGVPSSDFVFLYLGRKSKDKGVYDLIQAYDRLIQKGYSGCRLLLVGPVEDDQYGKVLAGLPAQTQSTITDIGKVSDPQKYFAIADAFCLFSYREGFGTVVIEAGAMGIPVMGTRISGLVDSIDDNFTGKLFEVKNIDQASKIMEQLLTEKSLSQQLGIHGRQRVEERFSATVVYQFLKKFYQENLKF
jgi:glycosyltransferase involved in cell wall biosynthesis